MTYIAVCTECPTNERGKICGAVLDTLEDRADWIAAHRAATGHTLIGQGVQLNDGALKTGVTS